MKSFFKINTTVKRSSNQLFQSEVFIVIWNLWSNKQFRTTELQQMPDIKMHDWPSIFRSCRGTCSAPVNIVSLGVHKPVNNNMNIYPILGTMTHQCSQLQLVFSFLILFIFSTTQSTFTTLSPVDILVKGRFAKPRQFRIYYVAKKLSAYTLKSLQQLNKQLACCQFENVPH